MCFCCDIIIHIVVNSIDPVKYRYIIKYMQGSNRKTFLVILLMMSCACNDVFIFSEVAPVMTRSIYCVLKFRE